MPPTVSPEEFKAELRVAALKRRDALPAEERAAAAQAVAAQRFPIGFKPGAIVSAYSPLRSEINPVPLMRKLADAGARLALPVVIGRGKPLIMREWAFGQPLASGVWGIKEPLPDAPEVWPDIVIAPLAAFDRKGHRVGYGAGYYDLTINRLRVLNSSVLTVGLAYQAQHVAVVPITPRDARLDYILTEREVIDCRSWKLV
jgi:5-formyltetrahydrofolate cyclo-ligase